MNPYDYNELDKEKKQVLLQAMMGNVPRQTLDERIKQMVEGIPPGHQPAESYYDKTEGKRRATNEPLEIVLSASVPRGYVRDLKTGTIYKLDTWLARVEAGLASWESAEKGKG